VTAVGGAPSGHQVTAPADADNVSDYLISFRSFGEYEAMFMLTDSDLHGRLLDCPGGASSFTAQASALGAFVTAADPVYAMSVPALQELVKGESDRGSAHTAAGIDRYRWDFYRDLCRSIGSSLSPPRADRVAPDLPARSPSVSTP